MTSPSLYGICAAVALITACGSSQAPAPQNGKGAEAGKSSAIYREASAETGLKFHHFNGATGDYYFPEIVGSGVALFDYDNDGDLDVYLVQGDVLNQTKSWEEALVPIPKGHPRGNRLFRNELTETGALRFTDVTEAAGVGHQGVGMGVAVGDFDNDGYADLYVTNFGHNVLYRNRGDGTFADVTKASGIAQSEFSSSAAFFDYDGDGDLDLYVVNYVDFKVVVNQRCASVTGDREFCGPQVFKPAADRLYRNEGGGRFTDVSAPSGIGSAPAPGLGVAVSDFNGDGRPDLYIANDGRANQLWLNRGAGRFEETALISGSAYNANGQAEAGMGAAAGDFDGDGDDDIFITNQKMETNTLYVNDGTGNFYDRTAESGLGHASRLATGFGCGWLDFDNDGHLDLFAANGGVLAEREFVGKSPFPYQQPNQLFRNGGSNRFSDVSQEAGGAFVLPEVSRGAAFGDIDNDGDMDIVVTNSSGPVRLFLNDTGNRKPWLRVALAGTKSNREGAGAQVAILRKGKPPVWRRAHRDGSYMSASDIRVLFGLGDEASVEGIGVRWPSGLAERWSQGISVKSQILLTEGTGKPWKPGAGDTSPKP